MSDGGTSSSPDAGSPDAGELPPTRWRRVEADAPELHFNGRADWSSPSGPCFSFPGFSIRFVLHGSAARVHLLDRSRDEYPDGSPKLSSYAVYIDGAFAHRFETTEGEGVYPVAEGLSATPHEIEIFRETEGWLAETQFLGLDIPDSGGLEPILAQKRRIEFVGDSVVTGYGALGSTTNKCVFDRNDQNFRFSYANIAARLLDAEARAEAASGIGIARNRNGTTRLLADTLYSRSVTADARTSWSADGWKADAVVTQFGTNDFAGGPVNDSDFVERYLALLETVRSGHPKAMVFVALDPMLSDAWPKDAQERTRARTLLERVVAQREADGDERVRFVELPQQTDSEMGCDFHPNAAKHQVIGELLAKVIKAELGW